MAVLDVTIVNVALPSIRADLGFSEAELVWVINAYMLTCGGFLLLGGRLGDLYGQRRLFMIGIALFSVASLACGLASAQLPLVIARALQGIGGAIVEAVALALLMNLFTEPAERAKAMGVYGFVCASGGSIGVLLGGVLTDAYDWHWIFLVNLPIGLAVLGLSLLVLPGAKSEGPRPRLDVGGAVTVTAALLLAVYAIVGGNEIGWTAPRTLMLLAAAAVLLAIFIAIEAVVAEPLMPLRFFRLETLAVSNVIGILWSAAMFAWFFLSALYMQRVLGYTPMQVGLAFLPGNIVMAVCSLGISAWVVNRYGIRWPLAGGLAAAAARPAAVRPRAGRRRLRRRRAARHAAARPRRRHRLQSAAAGGDERRRRARGRARLGHRQHLVHDGRRARPGGAGQPGGGAGRAAGAAAAPTRSPP